MLTGDCICLGDDTFRRHEVFELQWQDASWSDHTCVRAAFNGGPMLVYTPCRYSLDQRIYIYDAAGVLVTSVIISGDIFDLGWSFDEELVIVSPSAGLSVYSMSGEFSRHLSLGIESRHIQLRSVQLFHTLDKALCGVVIECDTGRFFTHLLSEEQDDSVVELSVLPACTTGETYSCWTCLPLTHPVSVVAARATDLYRLEYDHKPTQMTACTQLYARHGFVAMRYNALCSLLAVLTDTCHFIVLSADLRKVYCQSQLDNCVQTLALRVDFVRHLQLCWCSDYAVLLVHDTSAWLINRSGDICSLSFESRVHTVSEIDCARLITLTSNEVIERMSAESLNVFRTGSMHSSVILMETYKAYKNNSSECYGYFQMIRDRVDEAVYSCVRAACAEHSLDKQRSLLSAAQFGLGLSSRAHNHLYYTTCNYLRIVNSMRGLQHPLAITYMQLYKTGSGHLLCMLQRRRLHYLAVRLCRLLRLPSQVGELPVWQSWTQCHVRHTLRTHWAPHTTPVLPSGGSHECADARQVVRHVLEVVGERSGVDFARVARLAVSWCEELGVDSRYRDDLVCQLLKLEPRVHCAIKVLNELNLAECALKYACFSGDMNAIYTSIFYLKDIGGHTKMQECLLKHPVAMCAYTSYLRQLSRHRDELCEIHKQRDNYHERALVLLGEASALNSVETILSALAEIRHMYQMSKSDIFVSHIEDHIGLVKRQAELEKSSTHTYVGLSLYETIAALTANQQPKLADTLRSTFRVTDRVYAHLRVGAMIRAKLWRDLDVLLSNKKSSSLYEFAIDSCLENRNAEAASRYMNYIQEPSRAKFLSRLSAIECAE